MRVRCKLRELRGRRSISEMARACAEHGLKISSGSLSLLERGLMLPPDRQIEALQNAYGAPITDWYMPGLLLELEHDPDDERGAA